MIADFHLARSVDELLRYHRMPAERPDVKAFAQWAIDQAQRLATPAMVYEWFPVQAVGARPSGWVTCSCIWGHTLIC